MPRLHGIVPVEEQDSCLDHMVWFLWRSRIHAQTTWYDSSGGAGFMPRLHGMVPVEEQAHA
jgi:cellobiose phosphorylase